MHSRWHLQPISAVIILEETTNIILTLTASRYSSKKNTPVSLWVILILEELMMPGMVSNYSLKRPGWFFVKHDWKVKMSEKSLHKLLIFIKII